MKQQFAAKHPWTILAAGAAIQVLTGLPAAWGVFQQPVMEEYGLSEQGAGYAFGILIAAFGVGCVLGGFLQDRHGPRCAGLWGTALLCGGFFAAGLLPPGSAEAFFLAFSIPAGLGTAFLYPSIQSCAQKWYADRKGLATGVIGGAVGLSGAFLTVFVRTAVRDFGSCRACLGGLLGTRGRSPCRYALWAVCFCRTRRRPGSPKNRRRTAKTPLTLPRGRCCAQSSTGCAPERCAFLPPQCCCSVPLF